MHAVRAHSTSTGAVVGQEAGSSDFNGIFLKLVDEHGEAAQLMTAVRAGSSAESRKNLYPSLRTALLAHEKTESSILYGELGRYPSLASIVETHKQEADELEATIRALDAIDFESEAWLPRFTELCDLVQQHVREEEDDFFPAALSALGPTMSADLRDAYVRAKPGFINSIQADSPTAM